MAPSTAIGSPTAAREMSSSFALIERGRIVMRPPDREGHGARVPWGSASGPLRRAGGPCRAPGVRPPRRLSGGGGEEEENGDDQKQPAKPTKPLHRNRSSRMYSDVAL